MEEHSRNDECKLKGSCLAFLCPAGLTLYSVNLDQDVSDVARTRVSWLHVQTDRIQNKTGCTTANLQVEGIPILQDMEQPERNLVHGRLRLDNKSIIRQYRNLQRTQTKSNIISHYTVHVLRTTNHTYFETFSKNK